MLGKHFELDVSYNQFGVFDSGTENPFNDWTSEHVAQGFSWRPESACFATPFGDGAHVFEVSVTDHSPLPDELACRALIVPAPRMSTQSLTVASIGSSQRIGMPINRGSLFVEFVPRNEGDIPLIRLKFFDENGPSFRMVKADTSAMANASLVTSARPT